MINNPDLDLDTLIRYEQQMGARAQATRARVTAMRADIPLRVLVQQAREVGPRPALHDQLAQGGFTILDYHTESLFEGAHDPSCASIAAGDPDQPGPTPQPDGLDPQPHTGSVYKLTDGGVAPGFQHHLACARQQSQDLLICEDTIVDPWQIWWAKAMGFSAVILPIGAQVTPDLSGSIRVCQEVGLGWILQANYTHEIQEGLAAYLDAFVDQPPFIALGLHLDGIPISHEQAIALAETQPLPDGGHYLPYCVADDCFTESVEAGTNPVVNAYRDAGFIGVIAVDSTNQRFSSGQSF